MRSDLTSTNDILFNKKGPWFVIGKACSPNPKKYNADIGNSGSHLRTESADNSKALTVTATSDAHPFCTLLYNTGLQWTWMQPVYMRRTYKPHMQKRNPTYQPCTCQAHPHYERMKLNAKTPSVGITALWGISEGRSCPTFEGRLQHRGWLEGQEQLLGVLAERATLVSGYDELPDEASPVSDIIVLVVLGQVEHVLSQQLGLYGTQEGGIL